MIPAQPHSTTTPRVAAFDEWIRGRFVDLNTELEDRYAAQDNRIDVRGVGDDLKAQLVDEGRDLIVALLEEGNTHEGFDLAFELLGNVGYYMAACRRHEITEPSRERTSPLVEASALAMHLGATRRDRAAFRHEPHGDLQPGRRRPVPHIHLAARREGLPRLQHPFGVRVHARGRRAAGGSTRWGCRTRPSTTCCSTPAMPSGTHSRSTPSSAAPSTSTSSSTASDRITSRTGSARRSIAGRTPATSPPSTRSTCCSACACRPTRRTHRSSWRSSPTSHRTSNGASTSRSGTPTCSTSSSRTPTPTTRTGSNDTHRPTSRCARRTVRPQRNTTMTSCTTSSRVPPIGSQPSSSRASRRAGRHSTCCCGRWRAFAIVASPPTVTTSRPATPTSHGCDLSSRT